MTVYEQKELPGMPAEQPTEGKSGKSGKARWYYVSDRQHKRMLAACGRCASGRLVSFDLADSRIMLFNSRRQAVDVAFQKGLIVNVYPYDLDLMRAHWKAGF